MKLKDFLKKDIEVDFESYFTDDWAIAFVGPVELTEEGEAMFAAILNKEVTELTEGHVMVEVKNEAQDELVRELFQYAAGYCTSETYEKYFVE